MGIALTKELVSSAKWNMVGTIFAESSLVINAIILAHFLFSTDYGIAAIVLSIIGFFVMLSQFGFASAIIGIKTFEKKSFDTLFTLSLATGILLYIILIYTGPHIAAYYKQQDLAKLLNVAGIGVIMSLLYGIPLAILQRNLEYKKIAIGKIVNSVTKSTIAITMAVIGYGVWSLIIPAIIGYAAATVYSLYAAKYYPKFKLHKKSIIQSLNYSISSFLSNIYNYICNNIVILVMGKVWQTSELGLYTFAATNQNKAYMILATQISSSIFPIFARISNDIPRIQKATLQIAKYSCFIIWPLFLLLIINASHIVPIVFGKHWIKLIPVLQIVCAIPMLRTLFIMVNPTLYAMRKPHISMFVAKMRVALYIGVITVAYIESTSLITTLVSIISAESIVALTYLFVLLRQLKCPIWKYLMNMKFPVFINLLLVFASLGTNYLLLKLGILSFITNLLSIFILLSIYSLFVYWHDANTVKSVYNTFIGRGKQA